MERWAKSVTRLQKESVVFSCFQVPRTAVKSVGLSPTAASNASKSGEPKRGGKPPNWVELPRHSWLLGETYITQQNEPTINRVACFNVLGGNKMYRALSSLVDSPPIQSGHGEAYVFSRGCL